MPENNENLLEDKSITKYDPKYISRFFLKIYTSDKWKMQKMKIKISKLCVPPLLETVLTFRPKLRCSFNFCINSKEHLGRKCSDCLVNVIHIIILKSNCLWR